MTLVKLVKGSMKKDMMVKDTFVETMELDGLSFQEVVAKMQKYSCSNFESLLPNNDLRYVNYDTIDWGAGKISGTTFCNDEEISKVCSFVYHKYMLQNPLHPDIFTSLRKMEAEIIQVRPSFKMKMQH